ncbi:MAG: DUF5606 domain-containing protein [Bacteroidales bacterium]|jgi:hypothetical protein|nr:DUF5606 domain-containing protein [Bacteroidales bacterium]MDD3724766.1 DUF5606 domain-containing protein [Bacteroidales bacterium]MDD4545347.1 DUF5606 domain-containing protein [Bacteroidales bacterium]
MDLSKILSISGKPGLYLLVSQTKTGALVESLLDGKRQPAFSNERISSLEDISIFTLEEDIPLKKVFELIYSKENGGECISHKSDNNKIVQYMEEILPDFDRDRVYVSDMKKLFSWYNILNAKGLITIEEVKEETI